MQRRAVAATLVSAILFVSLLSSSYIVASSLKDKMVYEEYLNAESALDTDRLIHTASAAYSLLYGEQSFLSNHTISCSSGISSIPKIELNEEGENFSLEEYIVPYIGDSNQVEGIFGTFSGTQNDGTNFIVQYNFSSSSNNGLVKIERQGRYFLHLGFRISEASSFCLDSSHIFDEAISSLKGICNKTIVSDVISFLSSEIEIEALLHGFSSSLYYKFLDGKGCGYLEYTLTIIQNGIDGPFGTFSSSLYHSNMIQL